MHLLNTTTLSLHSFFGKAVPEYAILSHRWDEKEVLFQDLKHSRGPEMPGYAKIQGCCAQARKDGWDYVWIDSCCIDKSSSAELSEAINSMYQWYKDAEVCYAFLSDVDSAADVIEEFSKSAWFKRGWTLQELLAPETVVFFDRNWIEFGTKDCLHDLISLITGIREDRLFSLGDACIAEKMSWASCRDTTRDEDEAYCLMGIFQVNMPLLYGEGRQAFRRLQLEILQTSDDESLFAWNPPVFLPLANKCSDILAPTPRSFEFSRNIKRSNNSSVVRGFFEGPRFPYTMTNKGLHMSLFLMPYEVLEDESDTLGLESALEYEKSIYSIYVAVLFSLCDKSNRSPTILLGRLKSNYESTRQQTDWTVFKILPPTWLFLDLVETRNKCQRWAEKLKLPVQHTMLPANRQFFVQFRLDQPPGYPPERHADKIMVNVSSFPQWGPGICCYRWSQRTLEFVPLGQGQHITTSSLSDLYFVNETTGDGVLLCEYKRTPGRPKITLLPLKLLQILETINSGRFISNWKSGIDLGDRASCRLGKGISISASIRRVGGNLEYQYIIDVGFHPTGSVPWPLSTKLRKANDSLLKALTKDSRKNNDGDEPIDVSFFDKEGTSTSRQQQSHNMIDWYEM
jgi:hypothetical protein